MGLFSPYETFESPLPENKVIGPEMLRSKIPPCKSCGAEINSHGYEFAGKAKLRKEGTKIGSGVVCPKCYRKFAKSLFIFNTVKELIVILLIGAVIFGVLAAIFYGKVIGSIATVIAGVSGVGCVLAFFIRMPLQETSEYHFLEFCSYLGSLPYKGPPELTLADVEDIEPHGLKWFFSPRDQVVPNPIAILVHKDNPLKEISIERLSQIFAGEIRSWKELGWDDISIRSYAPKEACRETGAFRRSVSKLRAFEPSEWPPASLFLLNAMREERGAIGFALYSHYDQLTTESPVKIVMVEDQECSYDNGNYPLWATNGDSLK